MIETDNIKGRDLGALKQNREKHSRIGLLDYIRNVTIPLKGALDIVIPNTLNKVYLFQDHHLLETLWQTLDTVFNGDIENLGVCFFQWTRSDTPLLVTKKKVKRELTHVNTPKLAFVILYFKMTSLTHEQPHNDFSLTSSGLKIKITYTIHRRRRQEDTWWYELDTTQFIAGYRMATSVYVYMEYFKLFKMPTILSNYCPNITQEEI